ncbi:MAG: DUF4278 domain-containing protein [Coleofasciculaceae cyanobacterium]
MKLCYRGISYQLTSSNVETVETGVLHKNRGLTDRKQLPLDQPSQPQLELKYRGVSYTTGKIAQLCFPEQLIKSSAVPTLNSI